MIISGDLSTDKIVEFLLSHECQFEILDKKLQDKVIVTFRKGEWTIWSEGELFTVNDCCDVMQGRPEWTLFFKQGLLNYALSNGRKVSPIPYNGRDEPAKGLCALIKALIVVDKNTEINVIQHYRNGSVSEDGEIMLSPRYDETLI